MTGKAALAALTLLALAQRGRAWSQDAADWPTYNHDPAGWRFNLLRREAANRWGERSLGSRAWSDLDGSVISLR